MNLSAGAPFPHSAILKKVFFYGSPLAEDGVGKVKGRTPGALKENFF
jgi:hypothetical protein